MKYLRTTIILLAASAALAGAAEVSDIVANAKPAIRMLFAAAQPRDSTN
jgi:hypothetical protein